MVVLSRERLHHYPNKASSDFLKQMQDKVDTLNQKYFPIVKQCLYKRALNLSSKLDNETILSASNRGVISTFSWRGKKFFKFFDATGLLKIGKKTALYM